MVLLTRAGPPAAAPAAACPAWRADRTRHPRASPGKASLDIFWLKDDSTHILDDLPAPNVLAQEIVEHLEAAPASFREVAAALPRSRETR
jgi:hypothetical protein